MYELSFGSIFDKKCELIVIPCNSMGGISNSMRNDLMMNDITNHPGIKDPGSVVFEQSKGGFTNAEVIGFATSVNAGAFKSDLKYIHNICEEIKYYCKSHNISVINIPMLGTGAGKLNVKDVFEVFKQSFGDEKDINVHIFLGSQKDYLSLSERSKQENHQVRNPRVFISYTGENEENRKWVKDFVCKLRKNGVNAILDVYHLKPGDDLAQWMTNQLCMADKVILICDKCYAIKADARKGGVGWETMLIQGDMMMNSLTSKYIFIVREKNFDDGIPMYAKTKYSLQWTNNETSEEEFNKLLYYIFDCDLEPELGSIPDCVLKKIQQQDICRC